MRNIQQKTSGWFAFALIWILSLRGSLAVEIKNLDVPDYFKIDKNASDHVILRCEYDLEEKGKPSFVLKWFKDDILIYQWISGHKPIVLAHMKDQIDPTYEESSNDLYKYSSLFIDDVNVNNSGNYKCVVSTPAGFDTESSYLQVIDTSQNYTLDVVVKHLENHTDVTCTVKNIYPEPTLFLWEDGKAVAIKTSEVTQENGLYTVTVSGSVVDAGDYEDDHDNDGLKDKVDEDDDNDGIKDHEDDDDDNDGIKDHEDQDNDGKDIYKCTLKIANTEFTDEDSETINGIGSVSPRVALIVTLAGLTMYRI